MKTSTLHQLQSRGVTFVAPETVYVASDVNPERIAPGVVIHPGCRLSGADLSIGPDCVIGAEAPATVCDCQLGAGVHLAGGFFERSTFLDGFKAGSGAHVRPGCLFEEGSSIAHSVGVKQTVFLPWVTAGSLINFCDALMAGGTGRKDHSEIGSSYIHFNFTPHQDKATASLVGDVPHGVLLNQPAIFLGGQGGLVGPCVIAYGTVIPAGQIWRGDIAAPGHLVAKPAFRAPINMPYDTRLYPSVKRVLRNNLRYIGNIAALDMWYRVARARFMLADPYAAACHAGARRRLAEILDERMARLDELARKVERSLACAPDAAAAGEHRAFVEGWPALKAALAAWLAARERAAVPEAVQAAIAAWPSADYLSAVQSLPADAAQTLAGWLEQTVSAASEPCHRCW
ncbi:MAG: UDP-N-acetylglucosamine pyrophosphorylase [Kiritimatiellae bacterium]|nr:UDP-N-acetylglucosamine pyrophosphorylase [Kiritimatiellia bacterium]MDD4172948.1 UDP-N-acetylglucosamine pyrophosphorylase [Kiritimatiellia bacterium]MDD4443251.1 UDP-N-acetylglucosamine pyrophosphorylase [Kiritimatiellia bacterium]